MRTLIGRIAVLFGAAAPAAVVTVYLGAAEASATICTQGCYSDARLKTGIRPI
jgi:hypothetical protein